MRPLAALLTAAVLCARSAFAEQLFEPYDRAVLGGMDKVTGQASRFTLAVGGTGAFGTLRVTLRACRKTPPYQAPESAAFLQITDGPQGHGAAVFSGWMLSSTPGVSALEHPVYDIWVLDCVDSRGSE